MELEKILDMLQYHSINTEGTFSTYNEINFVCLGEHQTPLEDVYGLVKNYLETQGFRLSGNPLPLDNKKHLKSIDFHMGKDKGILIGILDNIMGDYHVTISVDN